MDLITFTIIACHTDKIMLKLAMVYNTYAIHI